MNAASLTSKLGGHWHHRYGVAPCPVCQADGRADQNALTLADSGGRLLLHCKKMGCDFIGILAAAGLHPGDHQPPDPQEIAQREAEARAEAEKKERQAWRCWRDARQIGGTIAEQYLQRRGITCPLPETLRFHPDCWHGRTARTYPAMIALVEGADGFAVHRTYLAADGSGKADLGDASKMMLGSTRGGAVRLANAPGSLVVAEGIETTLSLASGLLGRPATHWAALSTSGLRGLRLPHNPGRLTIAPDGDQAGREAAHELALRAYGLGWQVSLLPAPDGADWNDVLRRKVAA